MDFHQNMTRKRTQLINNWLREPELIPRLTTEMVGSSFNQKCIIEKIPIKLVYIRITF